MEKRLHAINSTTTVMGYAIFMAFAVTIFRQIVKTDDPSYDFPTGILVVWFLLMGVLYVVGDVSHAKAFNEGGTAEFGLQIFALAPVVVSFVKNSIYFLRHRELPNPLHVVAFFLIFAGIAVYYAAENAKK